MVGQTYLSRITIKAEQQTEDWKKDIFCSGAGVLSGLKFVSFFFINHHRIFFLPSPLSLQILDTKVWVMPRSHFLRVLHWVEVVWNNSLSPIRDAWWRPHRGTQGSGRPGWSWMNDGNTSSTVVQHLEETDKLWNDKRLPVRNESPGGGVMIARERGSMFPHNLFAER